MRFLLASVLVVGCASDAPTDITGPFTGPTHRYVIDHYELPTTTDHARQLADDLNGDGQIDNQAGFAIAALVPHGDITTHGDDMIASGAITAEVIVQADDLADDPAVGITLAGIPGGAVELGAAITDGTAVSNRTRDTASPRTAIVRLPVFADADPIDVPVTGVEVVLVPDGDGGYDGELHGGIPRDQAIAAITTALQQMIGAAPDHHQVMIRILDANVDGVITDDEITTNTLIQSLLAPDLVLFGDDVVSIGVGFHLAPCDAGTCATPAASCFDRVQDGDETDVDCGGSCGACAAGARCEAPEDCQAAACVGGTCGAPSCSDGVLDGFETDVDCGLFCSPALCDPGQACHADNDCKQGSCIAEVCR